MEQVQKCRDIIQGNFRLLMSECNFEALLPKLIKNGVFPKDSIRIYEKFDRTTRWRLLFALPGMGPHSLDGLILSLQESNQTYIANKLLGLPDVPPTHTVPTFPARPRLTPMDLRTDRLHIAVVPSDRFYDDFRQDPTPYTMRSKSRGAVLIINNKVFATDKMRKGAQVDQENLVELFRQMGGYDVVLREDRTAMEMENDITEFSKSNILKSVNIMIVIIMSHGSEYVNEAQVKCVDDESVRTSWIERQFFGDTCPYMQNKPKIIIYQICRGRDLDRGVRTIETDGVGMDIPTRRHADMLICHSTSQGFKAHRDTELGSWYIQYLCEVLMKHAHNRDVGIILHMVDDYLRLAQSDDRDKTMQTPTFSNNGFRICYLNPGIYEENQQLCHYNI